MPIVHVRVDNRLIHGQFLLAWSKKVAFDHIIVTNDKVAADPFQANLLKAVAPQGYKVSVLSLKECAAYFMGPDIGGESVFILAKLPSDVVGLIEEGLQLDRVNLGNVAYEPNTKKVSKTVYLSEEDVRALKKLHELGVVITSRMLPGDPDVEFWPTIERTIPEWTKG